MPIINHDRMFRIRTYSREQEPSVEFFAFPATFENYVAQDRECWHLGISSVPTVYYVYKFLPDHIVKKIQTESTFLMLCMEMEAFIDVVTAIYDELVINKSIPAEKIILVAGSEGFYEEMIRVSTLYNRGQIKIVSFYAMEKAMNFDQRIVRPRMPRIFKKKFLNFNRRWRLHRPMLVGLLNSLNLLQHGYVSLAHSDDNLNWSDVWDQMIGINEHFKCDEALSLLNTNKESIMNIPPLYLDKDDLTINHFRVKITSMHYYEESYFSIVSETHYFDGPIFLTEKIFKPVVHRHPFILASVPNSLALFRSLGYKTFSPFFNEDYDLEQDPCKRMMMIVSEIQRLCNLSDDEWSKMLIELDKICDYNFQVLKNKTRNEDYITFHN